jgi:hypothetical protein
VYIKERSYLFEYELSIKVLREGVLLDALEGLHRVGCDGEIHILVQLLLLEHHFEIEFEGVLGGSCMGLRL